ncbi:AN1 zinc finger protein [Aspergillus steynii IBT 23096]|uniref:AN1 zinc finger protein n=1 Tax=Aspergillus steynii IBT 23096 TaxID=1392250 RepID=A0A2I2GCH3_9EURO|nr:AN1 zinc finger protein [Aspergillus steynii IBT 23096]PLB50570.1 AN1 zinc finger protein [Aspergillus steynii IBT 23096]
MSPISVSKGQTQPSGADPAESSFTQMADKDLESIGRHCQFEYCHQLDFLPFRCESCHGTYCLDHRSETAHRCARAGEWARRRNGQTSTSTSSSASAATQKPTIYNSDQCAHLQCKTLINTLTDPGVRCPNCTRQYCLKHRLREEHDCAKPTAPRGGAAAGAQHANETLKSMFARVRTWGKDKSAGLAPTPKPTSAAGRMQQLNAMKRAAKGDAAVPADRRVYLHVAGTAETERAEAPAGDFFFDARWKVGRVLDDAARRLHVENVNNRAGEEARLRIFHVESGEFLEFSESIGDGKVKSGHTIVLLRGAGVALGK